LEGIEHLPLEHIHIHTDYTCFEIKVHEIQGKNLKLSSARLFAPIQPPKTIAKIKPGKLVVVFCKYTEEEWPSLVKLNSHNIESRVLVVREGNEVKLEEPGFKIDGPLVDMIGQLYAEGDPQFQQWLLQTWNETIGNV